MTFRKKKSDQENICHEQRFKELFLSHKADGCMVQGTSLALLWTLHCAACVGKAMCWGGQRLAQTTWSKKEVGWATEALSECPWVSSLTCSFLRVTLDKALKFFFLSQPSWQMCLVVKKHQNDIEKQAVPLHCPFQGKQIIPQHSPPVHHQGFPACPLWSPVEKPGCNMSYTNGTVVYSDIVQCLFISQNVCTVMMAVLSVGFLLISNANIEWFFSFSPFP